MTTETDAATSVLKMAAVLHDEAWGLALQYVVDPRPMTLARIKELREGSDLLKWAAEGRGGTAYDLSAGV